MFLVVILKLESTAKQAVCIPFMGRKEVENSSYEKQTRLCQWTRKEQIQSQS